MDNIAKLLSYIRFFFFLYAKILRFPVVCATQSIVVFYNHFMIWRKKKLFWQWKYISMIVLVHATIFQSSQGFFLFCMEKARL